MHALLWLACVVAFVAGFAIGSALQAKHDAKTFRNIESAFEEALRQAALRRVGAVLKFPTAEELVAREKLQPVNIVKGFDDDD